MPSSDADTPLEHDHEEHLPIGPDNIPEYRDELHYLGRDTEKRYHYWDSKRNVIIVTTEKAETIKREDDIIYHYQLPGKIVHTCPLTATDKEWTDWITFIRNHECGWASRPATAVLSENWDKISRSLL